MSRAQNEVILADVIAHAPELKADVVADVGDKANLVDRIKETIARTGARLLMTDLGGHGTQYDRDATFGFMDEALRRMEAERIGGNRETDNR